ncbi:acyl-CoA thioester hydrolase [Microbacterium ginsengiterrae]|uniref:Acyl-CoA thioester hydrolase n=1 Tax=Microbacterium ginsengiterrae TaxID=546115 RepID=A0A7W9CER3_9MICO|nr:thioesterase family protein [Microbacterium paludicola]MBB5744278.1 acyl-CoA thioester hydrolase [Microbacterium ginsengiterrae]
MTEGRRLHLPIQLRWGDLDAFNHVNNTSMLKLLEEARVRAFWKADPGEDAPETAVLAAGIDAGVLTLIARQEIEYFAPVPYQRRPLDVQMWFGKLGGSSIDVCYEVYNDPASAERILYARSTAVVVLVDAASGRPTRITDEMRQVWSPYLGAPAEYTHRR